MAEGTSTGGVCYATQSEAGAMWCGSVNVSTAQGLLTCKNITTTLSSSAGGNVSFTWTRQLVDSAGTKTQSTVTGQTLPGCETYGVDYWQPYITAFIAAAVVLVAWQLLFRSLDREGS